MAEAPTGKGLLKLVTPEENYASDKGGEDTPEVAVFKSELARYILAEFQDAKNFRQTEGIDNELLHSLRTYKGRYSAEKLQQIQQFSGSQVYSRIIASKCRGATALLKDIYLGADNPWSLEPTPVPKLPDDIMGSIMQLVQTEAQALQMSGQQVDEGALQVRVRSLHESAKKAALKTAVRETKLAKAHMQDMLTEGGFYEALNAFLADLPIFPYAVIKGPVLRKHTQISWVDGQPTLAEKPKMFWNRVSPFDVWFAPAASTVRQSPVMERVPLTRDELADLRGMPGYDDGAIESILGDYDHKTSAWSSWATVFDVERADMENKERIVEARDKRFLDTLEYHGYVRGQYLRDWGLGDDEVPDEFAEYHVTAWLICDRVIKVQVNPNPRQRPIYYVSSFEKVPGALIGHGLPQILSDIQDVANATLRALVNNLSIASGPQVVINDTRMAANADKTSLYPWKRWYVESDPYGGNTEKPIDFYQPTSHAHELLNVYKEFSNMADEISAIPRYMTGGARAGGAASTASGLAMLMNNSSKVMQSVVAAIDNDVIKPALEELYDMVMLLNEGELRGDEMIVVKGVSNALRKEQDRHRQLEFLQVTANPIDAQIIGPENRAALLRAVSNDIGLPYENLVPSEEEIQGGMQGPPEGGEPQPGMAPPAKPTEGGPPHLNTQTNARQT